MKRMTIQEVKEITGLSLQQISNKTQIPYDRVLKLNKQAVKYREIDYLRIKKFMDNRGKNIIHVDFTVNNTDSRHLYSWERSREVDLHEYKLRKRREEKKKNTFAITDYRKLYNRCNNK